MSTAQVAIEDRWTLARPQIIGEISSEERPEPISPIALKRIAAKGLRVRRLPRIATLANQGPADEGELLSAVPRGLPYNEMRRVSSAAVRRLRKKEDLERRLAVQPDCADCGILMSSEMKKGIAFRCAGVVQRGSLEILVCQRCRSIDGQRRPGDAA